MQAKFPSVKPRLLTASLHIYIKFVNIISIFVYPFFVDNDIRPSFIVCIFFK